MVKLQILLYVFVHVYMCWCCVVYLSKWLAWSNANYLTDAILSYSCIYVVRNGDFKVMLVKENVEKATADTSLPPSLVEQKQ